MSGFASEAQLTASDYRIVRDANRRKWVLLLLFVGRHRIGEKVFGWSYSRTELHCVRTLVNDVHRGTNSSQPTTHHKNIMSDWMMCTLCLCMC